MFHGNIYAYHCQWKFVLEVNNVSE